MYKQFIDTLRDPAVRDLAWVIGSPGLLDPSHPMYKGQVVDDAWCSVQLKACEPWLSELDLTPYLLHDFIASRPTRRLGHYFETLINYWLQHMQGTQIIATNLQVQQEQRTLGEYDFLFRDNNDVVTHWEAAIKFYLQQEPLAEQRAFIGPGTRDRLDLKMDRVFQHQLLLGYTPAGQLGLPAGIKLQQTQAFIKGYLFYHASASNTMDIQGVSTHHLSGWWIRYSMEKLPQTSPHSRWIILPRLRWLAPAHVADDTDLMSSTTLNVMLDAHFKLGSNAVLVFEMARTAAGAWREQSRGFVVCSSWPLIENVEIELNSKSLIEQ